MHPVCWYVLFKAKSFFKHSSMKLEYILVILWLLVHIVSRINTVALISHIESMHAIVSEMNVYPVYLYALYN